MFGSENLTVSILTGLGVFYLLVVLLNAGFVAYQHFVAKNRTETLIWSAVAGVFLIFSLVYFAGAFWWGTAERRVTAAEDRLKELQAGGASDEDDGAGENDVSKAQKRLESAKGFAAWLVVPYWF